MKSETNKAVSHGQQHPQKMHNPQNSSFWPNKIDSNSMLENPPNQVIHSGGKVSGGVDSENWKLKRVGLKRNSGKYFQAFRLKQTL